MHEILGRLLWVRLDLCNEPWFDVVRVVFDTLQIFGYYFYNYKFVDSLWIVTIYIIFQYSTPVQRISRSPRLSSNSSYYRCESLVALSKTFAIILATFQISTRILECRKQSFGCDIRLEAKMWQFTRFTVSSSLTSTALQVFNKLVEYSSNKVTSWNFLLKKNLIQEIILENPLLKSIEEFLHVAN